MTSDQVMSETSARRETRQPAPRTSGLTVAAVVTGVLLLVLWRTGPGQVPFVPRFEEIARSWPLSPVEDREAYVLRASLGQVLYALSPLQGLGVFLLLHVAALAVTALLLTAWLVLHCGGARGTVAVLVLLLSPPTAVLLLWIGMYDAFSVLVWVLLLATLSVRGTLRVPLQVAAAFLCGLQNFEQSLIGVVLVALLPELYRAARLAPSIPALVGGLLLGKGVLEVYLRQAGAPSGSRLSFLLDDPSMLTATFTTFALTAPLLVFSALGGLWVYVAPAVGRLWPAWGRATRIRFALAALGWLGAGIIALDHSRAMALTGFPLVVMLAILVADRYRDVGSFVRSPSTWVLMLVPPVIVWDKITLPIGVKTGVWGIGPF